MLVILVGFSLLTMTTGAVSYMHGYYLGGYILTLGFVITTFGMALWLRDIITEAIIQINFNKIFILKHLSYKLVYFNSMILYYLFSIILKQLVYLYFPNLKKTVNLILFWLI